MDHLNNEMKDGISDVAVQVLHKLIPSLKKGNDKILRSGRYHAIKKDDQPNEIYLESVRQVNRIKPHSTTDYFPAQLFKNLSPHREEEEADWIKHNYECVTLPVWMDFQSTIKRGTNPNNYKIKFDGEMPSEYEDGNGPMEYLNDQIKLYGSIHTWFSSVLFDVKLKDPNGVVAVQPYDLKTEQNEAGETVISSEDMLEPVPIYYESGQVMAFQEDEWYFLLSKEQVKLSEQHNANPGFVFMFFDKERIVRLEQTGKYTDWTFDHIELYRHDWGYVPVWKLKGQPEMRSTKVYFQSPFDFAVGNLNLALKNHMNKQMAEANGAWPHKIMVAAPCDNVGDNDESCTMGRIWVNNKDSEGEGRMAACPKCKGRGYLDKPSPGSTLMIDENQLTQDSLGIERIRFVAPDPSILKHLAETVRENENRARDILHIYSTNSEATGQDPTATGKWIDNNAMLAFMMPIVSEGFDMYEDIIQSMAPCDNVGDNDESCTMGRIWVNNKDSEGEGRMAACPKCKGRGYLDKPSPGSTLMIDENQLTQDSLGIERIRFVAPDPSILKHLAETVRENENRARDILHIYSTNSEATGQDPTATGKWIDNNAMLAFMMPIVSEGFDMYEDIIQSMVAMRYGGAVPEPTIVRPTDFDYRTSADYLDQYTDLLSKGAPPVVLIKILEKYIEKMFYADGKDKQVFKLILAADSVVAKKDDEIRNMVGAGTLAKWQAILHHNVFRFINEIMEEDDKFFDKEMKEQKEVLIQKAKDEAALITTSSETITSPFDGLDISNRAA